MAVMCSRAGRSCAQKAVTSGLSWICCLCILKIPLLPGARTSAERTPAFMPFVSPSCTQQAPPSSSGGHAAVPALRRALPVAFTSSDSVMALRTFIFESDVRHFIRHHARQAFSIPVFRRQGRAASGNAVCDRPPAVFKIFLPGLRVLEWGGQFALVQGKCVSAHIREHAFSVRSRLVRARRAFTSARSQSPHLSSPSPVLAADGDDPGVRVACGCFLCISQCQNQSRAARPFY